MKISYLQFADDTSFRPAKKQILNNFRKLLDFFGLMSSLDINYSKSAMIPLNCDDD